MTQIAPAASALAGQHYNLLSTGTNLQVHSAVLAFKCFHHSPRAACCQLFAASEVVQQYPTILQPREDETSMSTENKSHKTLIAAAIGAGAAAIGCAVVYFEARKADRDYEKVPNNQIKKIQSTVVLNVYDLGAEGKFGKLSSDTFLGLFHAGTEIDGEEWSFGATQGERTGTPPPPPSPLRVCLCACLHHGGLPGQTHVHAQMPLCAQASSRTSRLNAQCTSIESRSISARLHCRPNRSLRR